MATLTRRSFLGAVATGTLGATTRPSRRDVTFLVASDLHYGQDQWGTDEAANQSAIAVLNGLPGTPWPDGGGVVGHPRAVLVPGDLTDSGTASNFDGYWLGRTHAGYATDVPVNGGRGPRQLRFPVVEGYGNHDVHDQVGDAVIHGIVARNRASTLPGRSFCPLGLHSAWDWDDVRFVNVGLYPGGPGDARSSLAFLSADLARHVGASGRPVVVMQHYGFDAFSRGDRWWTDAERDAYADAIKGYNVAAVFSGHQHWADRIPWSGTVNYVLPRAKGDNGTDGVYAVRIAGDRLTVAHRRLAGRWDHVWTQAVG